MIFSSTLRTCAARDGAITSATEMLLWERDSSQVFLLYLWQLHSTHESYFMHLLFANQQCWASIFNNISYQISGKAKWNIGAKKAIVASWFFFFFSQEVYLWGIADMSLKLNRVRQWLNQHQSITRSRTATSEEQHREKFLMITLWINANLHDFEDLIILIGLNDLNVFADL